MIDPAFKVRQIDDAKKFFMYIAVFFLGAGVWSFDKPESTQSALAVLCLLWGVAAYRCNVVKQDILSWHERCSRDPNNKEFFKIYDNLLSKPIWRGVLGL